MIKTHIDPITSFYLNSASLRVHLGFVWSDVMMFSDEQLETQHNYIQWLFPTYDVSQFNHDAPVPSPYTLVFFEDFDIIRERMFESYRKMKDFYFTGGKGWDRWITPYNHNFLRITRIIKSLKIFGWEDQAHEIYDWCQVVLKHQHYAEIIGEETQKYWKEAIESH